MVTTTFHSPTHSDNKTLVDFAHREMGSQVVIDDFSRDVGRRTTVWRLTGRDGSRAWLKHHEQSQLYKRELIGLEHFVPALGTQTFWCTPSLIAHDDVMEVILMTEVEGAIFESTQTSMDEALTMYTLAGRFSRALHRLNVATPNLAGSGLSGPDDTPAPTYLRHQLEHYLGKGMASIDADTAHWTRELIAQACCANNGERVPCHMDYSPRNWIIQRQNTGIKFGVIDWERTRWDTWLQDIQRMVYDEWYKEPRLREAYFQGYGRSLTAAEELLLDTLCLVTAIAGIPWAENHNDYQFAAHNRTIIDRIRAKSR